MTFFPVRVAKVSKQLESSTKTLTGVQGIQETKLAQADIQMIFSAPCY